MTTNQLESTQARLSRLETFLVNVGETVVDHDNTIDVLVANISQLTENLNNLAEQTNRNINNLAQQAAQDRQQAAIDSQKAAINHQVTLAEIQRIWQYLLDRNPGNGRTGE